MDAGRLRARGWSEEEIAHAMRAMVRAEERRHPGLKTLERATLVALLLLIGCGVVIAAVRLAPLTAIASPYLSIPIAFILGLGLGLLFVVALRDLKPTRAGHTLGVIIAAGSFLIITVVALNAVGRRMAALGEPRIGAWAIAVTITVGMLLPYLMTWRAHGPS